MNSSKKIFVVGPARSGTTYLAHTIASKMKLRCSPETNAFAILKKIWAFNPRLTFNEFEEVQENFLMHGPHRRVKLKFAEEMQNICIVDQPKYFVNVLLAMDSYTDGSDIIEHTPRNGENLELVRWMYPEDIIIFVLRNPIAIIFSQRRVPWGSKNPIILLYLITLQYASVIKLMLNENKRNLLIVRYEKLSKASYQDFIIRKLESNGFLRRDNPITVCPKNADPSAWAKSHFDQSTKKQFIRKNSDHGLWRHLLVRLGFRVELSVMKMLYRNKNSWEMRLLLWYPTIVGRFVRR